MTGVTSASRSTLELFAARLIVEHRANGQGLCGECARWSPCRVERHAIELGLAPPTPSYFELENDHWKITATDDRIALETDWRTHGRGKLVQFDRQAVEASERIPEGPWSPEVRDAWAAARRWVLEQRSGRGVR